MNKPEWMPENPYFYKTGYDDTSLSIGFREGSNTTAKKLLEYQLAKAKAMKVGTVRTELGLWIESMLKQLEENDG